MVAGYRKLQTLPAFLDRKHVGIFLVFFRWEKVGRKKEIGRGCLLPVYFYNYSIALHHTGGGGGGLYPY